MRKLATDNLKATGAAVKAGAEGRLVMENQNVEFKESWRDEYLKWVCGFANASGGKMFIGIRDDGTVCGAENAKRLLEEIPNKIVSTLGIVADVNLVSKDGKNCIEIAVEPSAMPISYKGVYHYRSGATKQELNGAALQHFILKKYGRLWDDLPRDATTIDAIDRRVVDYFLRRAIRSGRLGESMHGADTQTVLENLNLVTEDGRIKNAAVLLFASNPQKYVPAVQFKIGRFGVDNTDLLAQDLIEGDILEMADKVMDTLDRKYLVRPIHYEGLQRIEPLEIPEAALREVVYNAIIHKDYSGPAILMWVYSDRIEIWNYGGLPDGKDIGWLMGAHSSMPRNKNIATAFYRAGFIESWGRGIDKINNAFIAEGLEPPKFEQWDDGIRVIIKRENYMKIESARNAVANDAVKRVGHNADDLAEFGVKFGVNAMEFGVKFGVNATKFGAGLSQNDLIVYTAIEMIPALTAAKIASAMGITKRGAEKLLDRLKVNNHIRRVGPDKGGHWEVVK